MAGYDAPAVDMAFTLKEVVGIDDLADLSVFSEVGLEIVPDMLEEAARFFGEVIAPTNRVGDTVGSQRNDDGTVTTADGFKQAYRQYVEAGWGAMSFEPEHGGGGFPWLVGTAISEMFTASNMALSLNPLLTQGAIHALVAHGSSEQQAVWLPKLISGEWTGTMNLTEPQAGSDVGALTTKAHRQDDGTYRIVGQKIFITWGEHDMTDNTVHLVLARTPDAPQGTRGISLFIVPKHLLNDDGTPGRRNDVRCVSLEHKMGIHGSPTCVLQFGDDDGAVGYIVGDEQSGMRSMFTMMNQARLGVGLEGLAVADRSYQQALAFAIERQQGRRPQTPTSEAAPIIEHPDIRRMLMTMKAYIEAMRCLTYLNAASIDRAHHHPDEEQRRRSQELADLLTPLSKAWCTDLGNELTSLGLQIHGGMGYVEEAEAAQHYRDIRIGAIYEGTNGIQAIDLVQRKLPLRGGAVVGDLFDDMTTTADELAAEGLTDIAKRLETAVGDLRTATDWLTGAADSDDALAGASPYLRLFGQTVGGWLLARSALAAHRRLADGDPNAGYLDAKIVTAQFYAEQLLPLASGLLPSIVAKAPALYAIPVSQLR